MFVLGGIGSVFAVLAVIFWIYFMYLWRTWDANKREHLTVAELEGELGMGAGGAAGGSMVGGGGGGDDDDDIMDDAMSAALLNSRRKSVSFTVARLGSVGGDAGSFTFDLSTRSVPIGSTGGASGGGSAGGSRSNSRTGSSCTIVGSVADGASSANLLKAVTASPTPSAPVGEWRRNSMEVSAPATSRRLSLAPEDALLHHSYSLYSPSASAARAKYLRRESEGNTAVTRSRSPSRFQMRTSQRRLQQQQQLAQEKQQQQEGRKESTIETAI